MRESVTLRHGQQAPFFLLKTLRRLPEECGGVARSFLSAAWLVSPHVRAWVWHARPVAASF
ncbi:MAG UNVERIFIED_CONTAM: hypothetical protein LOD86_11925, partial [Thermobifida fusca]